MKLKILFACFLWGSAFAGAKIGMQYAGPILLSGMRFTLAGLLLLPIVFLKRIDFIGLVKRNWKFMLLFAFVQTFLQYGLFFMGLDRVEGATSSIIIGAGPLFMAIMAHLALKNDKMTVRKMLAIALGFSGIIFISLAKGGVSADNPGFYAGVGLLLLSNIVGGYTNIMIVKKKDRQISPYAITSFANFFGGLMLLAVSFVVEKPSRFDFPLEYYVALLWLAFIPAAALSIWYSLLNREDVKVSEIVIWKFLIPVFGSVLSWILVKGEHPDVPTVVGILIISVALILMQTPKGLLLKLIRRKV